MGDDADKGTLEELIAVEENIIGKPRAGCSNHSRAKVTKSKLQGLSVVAGDLALLFCRGQLLACCPHLEGTVIDEPKCPDGRESKRNTERPLSSNSRVGCVSTTVVEGQEQDNKDSLIGQLTPSLHQKGTGDLASTVKAVLLGRDLARADSILHTGCGSHRVFSANTDTVEEERPSITDDPSVLSHTPRCSKHEQTQKHDGSILNETPTSTQPAARSEMHRCSGGELIRTSRRGRQPDIGRQ